MTQLYVSVDAATPASLKAVDRPLFADFWDRFTGSLAALRDTRQRTVYRCVRAPGGEETRAWRGLRNQTEPPQVTRPTSAPHVKPCLLALNPMSTAVEPDAVMNGLTPGYLEGPT